MLYVFLYDFVWLFFSFRFILLFIKIKIKRIEKYKNSACLCILVLVYLKMAFETKFSKLCISYILDEHLNAQLSKQVSSVARVCDEYY